MESINSILLLLIIVSVNVGVDGLKCTAGIEGFSHIVDCSDKRFGMFHDKCITSVTANGTDVMAQNNCLPKATSTAKCGQLEKSGSISTKICCCDSDLCNDDEFLNQCKSSIAATSSPTPFQCINKNGNINARMNCLSQCAVVMEKKSSGESSSIHTCLSDRYSPSDCGKQQLKDGGITTKVCCCNGTECNDDDFADRCLLNSASNVLLGSALILMSILVSAVVIMV